MADRERPHPHVLEWPTPELGCCDCGWTGASKDCKEYPEYGTAAWRAGMKATRECPSCGSDVIPFAEYLTEKAEDR